MTPERLEALLWDRIDGTISANDRAELEEHLAADPEARMLADELLDLNALLAALPSAPRPAGLRDAIDQSLAAARPPAASSAVHRAVTGRRPTVRWRTRLLPLAAGLLVGAAVAHLLHLGAGRPVSEISAAGSMAAATGQGEVRGEEIDLGPDVGSVTAGRDGPVLAIDVELSGVSELRLVLEANRGDLILVGTSQTEMPVSDARADGGRLVLTALGPGRIGLAVSTEDETARTRITVSVDGQMAAERWLDEAVGEVIP